MKIDLKVIPIDIILVTKDYVEGTYNLQIDVTYDMNYAILTFNNTATEAIFNNELGDFIKRKQIAYETRTVKEIIIGRALYGIVEQMNN